MKTSTEWFEIRRKQINETRNTAPSKEFYEAIQLDAFKAGAEWAAKICFESARVKLSQEVHDIGNLILGETSEINELPK